MNLTSILIMVVIVMGAGGYVYYTDTQKRIAILTENNAKLELAVQQNEEALKSLEASYASAQEELSNINAEYQNIRRQNQELADKLQKIDLTAAAIANPEGIESAVNRGTLNAGRCFELLSGAELNEKERNAENGIAFNKECPWLYDTYKLNGLLDTAHQN
tara:strand:- start:7672 stop:8154 length:483 start_codon:yes stop_codon:yes gene_type:complete